MTKEVVRPRVSLGLPVFNGEKYLAETLDAILAQTYRNFELIISDNASTDGTEAICRAYSANDGRIHYHRNETNLGLSKNYGRVFELSSGEYFKWVTYDDLLAPEYLDSCVEVLDSDPSVVVVHSKSYRIDESGEIRGSYDYDMNLESPRLQDRFRDLVTVRHSCNESQGLIRSDVLARTPLQANFVGSDRTLMAELGLRGRIHVLPEYLFFRRDHPQTGSNIPIQERSNWFDPAGSGRLRLPHCREVVEYFISLHRVPLRFAERLSCYVILLKYARTRRRLLLSEIKVAFNLILRRSKLMRSLLAAIKRPPPTVSSNQTQR
jgi:glycosyltransferase involved in cell wall biosynthesis